MLISSTAVTGSQISADVIATGYGFYDRGVRGRVPVEARFYLLHSVQTGSGAHSHSYPMGTGGSFLEVKAAGA
jgi:hypothetical protein